MLADLGGWHVGVSVVWFALGILALVQVWRDPRRSQLVKVAWTIVIVAIPLLGVAGWLVNYVLGTASEALARRNARHSAAHRGADTAYLLRDVDAGDAASWAVLYRAYRTFYRLPDDDAAIATTWAWVSGRQHGMRGIVATRPDGELIALANLRAFARPSSASTGLYLDDLFTSPAARGAGAARALLRRASAIAGEDGSTVVRWITARDNVTARRLYDGIAAETPWVTYDLKPEPWTAGP